MEKNGKNPKIEFLGKFTLRQREVIRVAAIVAAYNFPMPSRVRIYRLPRPWLKGTDGMALPGCVWLRGNMYGAHLFSTVSHEFRHVSDYYTGKLVSTVEAQYWHGRRVDRMEYEKQPHEKAAMKYERQLFPRIFKRK